MIFAHVQWSRSRSTFSIAQSAIRIASLGMIGLPVISLAEENAAQVLLAGTLPILWAVPARENGIARCLTLFFLCVCAAGSLLNTRKRKL